jgi:Cytochrome c oxidase subunit IV
VKIETTLFAAGAFFFIPLAIIYGIVTSWHEPVGAAALLLTGGLSLLIGLFLAITSRRIDPRPEDDPSADISEGAGDQGVFAPYSWWPLPLAFAGALVFAGLAVGWWLVAIGMVLGSIALVGWVYEFYRGEHAH